MQHYGKLDMDRVALKRRRTKIVATLGPASRSPEVLDQLVEAGVDMVRLNMSHGTHDGHERDFRALKEAAERAGRFIGVLADLCGPKIRVGRFAGGGIDLEAGAGVVVTTRQCEGREGLIPSRYEALARDVKQGDRILLNDGHLELTVENVDGDDIQCQVVYGGRLTDLKGMNLPGVNVSAPALTAKDRADAEFAMGLGVDFLALSFVRAPEDVLQLERLIQRAGADTSVISKIEKPEALERIDEILRVSRGIMIARGDLGVELPVEDVPLIQRELVTMAVNSNRPVIMATQMLESMIDSARPTRAEATDVAAAATLGADAVMLSAETAVGNFPVQAVETMDRVLRSVEGYQWSKGQFASLRGDHHGRATDGSHPLRVSEGLARAASQLSRALAVRAVVVPTESGRTARWIASERPAAPLLALSPSEQVCRKAKLLWGVTPVQVTREDLARVQATARRVVLNLALAEPGHPVLLVWDPNTDVRPQPTITVLEV